MAVEASCMRHGDDDDDDDDDDGDEEDEAWSDLFSDIFGFDLDVPPKCLLDVMFHRLRHHTSSSSSSSSSS